MPLENKGSEHRIDEALLSGGESGQGGAMRAKLKLIGVAVAGVGGSLLTVASQTSASDVATNLGSWLKLAGVQRVPSEVLGWPIDMAGLALGLLIVAGAAIWLFWPQGSPTPTPGKHQLPIEQTRPADASPRPERAPIYGTLIIEHFFGSREEGVPKSGWFHMLTILVLNGAARKIAGGMGQRGGSPGVLAFPGAKPGDIIHRCVITNLTDVVLVDVEFFSNVRLMAAERDENAKSVRSGAELGTFPLGCNIFKLGSGDGEKVTFFVEMHHDCWAEVWFADTATATVASTGQRVSLRVLHPGRNRIVIKPLEPGA